MAIVGYNIYVGGVKKNTSLITATTYNLTALAPGTSQNIEVRAVDDQGAESATDATQVKTILTKPGTVMGLTVTGSTTSSISLSWQALTGATSYKIERKLTSGSTWAEIAAGASGTTYVDSTGITSGSSYDYRIKGSNATGDSLAYSAILSATPTAKTTPVAPTPMYNDEADIIEFSHPLGVSEILYTADAGSTFQQYTGPISVPNANINAGLFFAKTKATGTRNESPASVASPAFTTSVIADNSNILAFFDADYGLSTDGSSWISSQGEIIYSLNLVSGKSAPVMKVDALPNGKNALVFSGNTAMDLVLSQTWAQPVNVWIIFKLFNYTTNANGTGTVHLFDSTANDSRVSGYLGRVSDTNALQNDIYANAGAATLIRTVDTAPLRSKFNILKFHFEGANTSVSNNDSPGQVYNPGANGLKTFRLGASYLLTNWFSGEIAGVLITKAQEATLEINTMAYIKKLYGIA